MYGTSLKSRVLHAPLSEQLEQPITAWGFFCSANAWHLADVTFYTTKAMVLKDDNLGECRRYDSREHLLEETRGQPNAVSMDRAVTSSVRNDSFHDVSKS